MSSPVASTCQPHGVEVVAATDYDQALMQSALRCEAGAMHAARNAAIAAVADAATPPPPPAPVPMPMAPAPIPLPPLPPAPPVAAVVEAPAVAAPAVRIPSPPAAVADTPAPADATPRAPAVVRALHRVTPPAAVEAPAPLPADVPVPTGVRVTADAETPRKQPALVAVPEPVVDPALAEMRRELGSMRELIEREVHRFADERLRGVPVRAMVLDELLDYGCDADMSRAIATAVPADADPGRARGMLLAMLAKSLLVPTKEPIFDNGVIALVGPTGVGKTTTLAKLAARYAAAGRARDVALVSADTYRMGAREQLAQYGRLLGMPVFESAGGDDLSRVLARLADYPLVLVDTAGFGQRDQALAAQFAWTNTPRPVRSLLVLPANAQPRDLDEVIRRFRCASPEAAILTKLDETGQLGAALSVVSRARVPLAYVTDGQRVPADLHRAEPHRLVLRLGELRRAADRDAEEARHVAA